MDNNSPLVTVFGGSGFLGRYVVRQLAKQGCRVRVAVRRPNEALFVKAYGSVGQIEPVQANIRDEASTLAAIRGASAVVNCVGIMHADSRQTFDAVQAKGAGRVARLAASQGVRHLVHVSAIGADARSDSQYEASKGAGEAAVRDEFPKAVILRPSLQFGTDDSFFNRLGAMAQLLPILPVIGAGTRFQPVFVDDVAEAVAQAVAGKAAPGLYELGGPEIVTMRQIMQKVTEVTQRRRLLIGLPFWAARIKAWFLDAGQFLSGGLVPNRILTGDQVRLLRRDNVVSKGASGLEAFGITPTPMDNVLESYLYRYRPHGQFDAITASAKNLRSQE